MRQDKILKIIAEEEKIRQEINTLKEEICLEIEARTMEGVTFVKSELNIAIIRFRTIQESNRMNLSPDYYLPKSQAELVRRKLKSATYMKDFVAYITEMYQKKCVTIGHESYSLNPVTLSVLEEYMLSKSDCCI